MTKYHFYLKAMLALAGNSKVMSLAENSNRDEFAKEISELAIAMVNVAEQAQDEFEEGFDCYSVADNLNDLHNDLENLNYIDERLAKIVRGNGFEYC